MHLIISEASITGIVRVLLIVLTVYTVYSLFIRFIIPSLMKKYIQNFQQRFTEQNQRQQPTQPLKKEGEISITYINKDENASHQPEAGEYVDYEEIK